MTPVPAIRVRHLWHRFGAMDVVRDLTFDVPAGEIFGFIGPNGAGKTTTIRIIATLLEPMAGRVEVDGHDVTLDPDRARRVIGYMPDHAGVYERITVNEYLAFFADAYGITPTGIVDTVLDLTDLSPLRTRLVATLSKGFRQRLQLARVLLHDPKILVLDEPASDLDPRARIELRDLLIELRDLGKTIFLSSHILTELADICSSVAILERGRLVVAGPLHEISDRLARQRSVRTHGETARPGPNGVSPVVVETATATTRRVKIRILGDAQAVRAHLSASPGVVSVEAYAGGVARVTYIGEYALLAQIVSHLVYCRVPVVGVEPERNELERIFMETTRDAVD